MANRSLIATASYMTLGNRKIFKYCNSLFRKNAFNIDCIKYESFPLLMSMLILNKIAKTTKPEGKQNSSKTTKQP